jgi:hypothetical protein
VVEKANYIFPLLAEEVSVEEKENYIYLHLEVAHPE